MKVTLGELRGAIREELSRVHGEALDERLRDAAIGLGIGAVAAMGAHRATHRPVAAHHGAVTKDSGDLRGAVRAMDEEAAGMILDDLWERHPRTRRSMTGPGYADLDARGKLDRFCVEDPAARMYLRVAPNGDITVK